MNELHKICVDVEQWIGTTLNVGSALNTQLAKAERQKGCCPLDPYPFLFQSEILHFCLSSKYLLIH